MTQPSEVPTSMSPAVMASQPTSQAGHRTASGGLSIGSLVHPQSEYRYGSVGTPNFGGFSRPAMPFSCGFAPSDDSLYFTPESSQSPVSEQYGRSTEELIKAHKFWVDYETRRRILQASSILDMQQMIFFKQPATIVQHYELWNASPIEEWEELAKTHQNLEYSTADLFQSHDSTPRLDYFQLQAWLQYDPASLDRFCNEDDFPNLSLLAHDGCSRSSLTFNKYAMNFIKHTPLNELLIVSGESWIFGKKLEKESEFEVAKRALRTWVGTSPDSLIALCDKRTYLELLKHQLVGFRSSFPNGSFRCGSRSQGLSRGNRRG
ncbi:hypothetical protein DV737_g4646, partial [Chaetothyriales sp. CBS 132003]